MTDIMKLAAQWGDARIMATRDRATNDEVLQARDALQSAIEALQAENERLTQDRDEWRDSTIAANANAASEEKRRREMQDQREALQAKLDAMGKGEPVAWRFVDDKDNGHVSYSTTPPTDAQVAYLKIWKRPAWQPLYAAPKALAPLTYDQIDELEKNDVFLGNIYEITKEIEAAHGIGGTP